MLPPLQISQGETFVTQTDTEVVPKLCKVVYARLHKLDLQVTFTQVRPLPVFPTQGSVLTGAAAACPPLMCQLAASASTMLRLPFRRQPKRQVSDSS